MAQKPIPLTNMQRSSLDELSGGSAIAMNVVSDKLGAVYKRPGLKTSDNLTSSVVNSNGLTSVHASYGGTVYATGPAYGVSDIYKLASGGVLNLSSDLETRLLGTSRPVLAETEALLVFVAGDDPQKVVLATAVSSRLGGTPPKATHVVGNRLRLVMNDPTVDKSKLRYSDFATGSVYAGNEIWSFGGVGTSGYTSAAARPDPIVGVYETADAVFAFGTTNLQIFTPDPNLVYAPANTLEVGCAAPYSVIRLDNNFAWLDHQRRFVLASGNEFQAISADIGKDIKGISTVSDCFGYRLRQDPFDLLVWTFPTDGRTFVYQLGGGWAQWAGYSLATSNWRLFKAACFTHNTVTDENIVGTTDGYAAVFNNDTYTDLGDPIKAYVESGFINRGTDNKKLCRAVHLRMRRETDTTVSPWLSVSYADFPGQWSSPERISLRYDVAGDIVVTLRSLGVYRNRNWRFEFDAGSKLVLSGVTEDYDELGA